MKTDPFGKFRDRTQFAPLATWGLCGLSVALSIAYWATGMHNNTWGYVSVDRIWSGDWGGLITSTLLHASPMQQPLHLLFNILVLLSFGPIVERALGRLEFIIFCAAAACVSSAAQIAVTSANPIGLSGVIYALVGVAWGAKRSVPAFQLIANTKNMQTLMGWLVLCFVLTEAHIMSVANYAHVGGLFFGVAVAWLFIARPVPIKFRVAGGALLAALVAVTVLAVAYLPWSPYWQYWHTARLAGVSDISDDSQ